jgi:hypothetical protein
MITIITIRIMIIIIKNYSSVDKCNVMMERRKRNSKKIATTN